MKFYTLLIFCMASVSCAHSNRTASSKLSTTRSVASSFGGTKVLNSTGEIKKISHYTVSGFSIPHITIQFDETADKAELSGGIYNFCLSDGDDGSRLPMLSENGMERMIIGAEKKLTLGFDEFYFVLLQQKIGSPCLLAVL